VRPKVMGTRRQQARRFSACRVDPLTVQPCKRVCHEGRPRGLSAAGGCLLQEEVVALGLSCHQAQPPSKRCILGQGDGFGGHGFGSTRAFLVPLRHDGLLHVPVARVRRPIGSPHKAIKACALPEEAHQAHATGADFGTHHVYPADEAMPASQTWEAVNKGHHSGTRIATCLVRLPRLEGPARHIELVGRLPLGETLGLQRAILIKARSAFKAIPACVVCLRALLPGLDSGAHHVLLVHPLPWSGHGSGWRGRLRIATLTEVESLDFSIVSFRPSGRSHDRGRDWAHQRGRV
jgi:hypothetical protein